MKLPVRIGKFDIEYEIVGIDNLYRAIWDSVVRKMDFAAASEVSGYVEFKIKEIPEYSVTILTFDFNGYSIEDDKLILYFDVANNYNYVLFALFLELAYGKEGEKLHSEFGDDFFHLRRFSFFELEKQKYTVAISVSAKQVTYQYLDEEGNEIKNLKIEGLTVNWHKFQRFNEQIAKVGGTVTIPAIFVLKFCGAFNKGLLLSTQTIIKLLLEKIKATKDILLRASGII